MKFNAAILTEQGQPLVLDQIELTTSLEYGQVLVKVIASGICGSQLGEIDGVKGPDKFLPHLLGHEGGGVVQEVGPGVTTIKLGDHVVLHWRKGNGIEAPIKSYRWGNKIVNAGRVTTFNEYAVVSENRVTVISKHIDFKVAALMGCAVLTGFGVVNNDAQIKIGQSVIVFGTGGVGLNIVQAASLSSAYPIIGIDINDEKLVLAKEMGLTHQFNALNEKDIILAVKNIVGSKGVDVAIDTTGNPRVIEQAYELTSAFGKTILVGVPKAGDNISIHSLPLHFDKILKGSHGGDANPERDIPNYLKLLKAEKLSLKKLITHEFSLNKINDAIDLMKSGKISGRVMIHLFE